MRFIRYFSLSVISCAFLGACAVKFNKTAINPQDALFKQELEKNISDSNDIDSKISLGRILFMHNHIDEADRILKDALTQAPNNMEALAWYGANRCKVAGRTNPWLLGMRKAFLAKRCLGKVARALSTEPDNFTIRLVSINTGLQVNAFGSLKKAERDLESLLKDISGQRSAYTPQAISHAYMAAAILYEKVNKKSDAGEYLRKIIELNAEPLLVRSAEKKLQRWKIAGGIPNTVGNLLNMEENRP